MNLSDLLLALKGEYSLHLFGFTIESLAIYGWNGKGFLVLIVMSLKMWLLQAFECRISNHMNKIDVGSMIP
jgi:hypothetical protein